MTRRMDRLQPAASQPNGRNKLSELTLRRIGIRNSPFDLRRLAALNLLVHETTSRRSDNVPDTTLILDPAADDQALLGQVVDFYHQTLKASPEALDYLRRRGVTDDQALDHFRLGYCNRSLGQHVPDKNDETGRRIRERLERLGLVHGRGHEYFINFVVCPIPAGDGSGQVVDIYGRRVFKNQHRAVSNSKHLSSERRGVWNVEGLAAAEEVILCASLFDALVFWCHGYHNVTCTFTKDTLPDDHLAAFRSLQTRRVLTPCRGLAPKLLEAGLECALIRFPNNQDGGGYARQADDPAQALGAVLRCAEPITKDTVLSLATEDVEEAAEPHTEAGPKKTRPASKKTKPSCNLTDEADDQQLLAQVVDYYHRTLKGSQEALDYLRHRGLTNGQAIEQFRIGYANRTLGKTLPAKTTEAGRDLRGRLERLGVFRATSGHEHFNGCVVFPITAADGTCRIVDLYGRKILGKRLKKHCLLDLHLSGQRQGVWNVEAFGATEEIILCPSIFDALTFWTHGYRNVTCMFGPDALTDDHLAAFQEFSIKRVLTPCEAVCPRLLQAGLDCYLLRFPSGLDANSYALQVNDPAQTLGVVLRKAEWFGKGAATTTTTPIITVPEPMPQAHAPPDLPEDEPEDVQADDVPDDAEPVQAAQIEAPPVEEPAPPVEMETVAMPILTASPLPPAPKDVDADSKEDEVVMTLGDRRYRVRGWSKNLSFDQLRVNVMASNERGLFVDTFDLYAAKHRRTFITQAAVELGVEENAVKKDLGRVLLKLEELQDKQIEAKLTPKDAQPVMNEEEKEEATRLLKDPHLLDRIMADFDVVGETTNKLVGYLAAVSRKLDQPLAVIIQSSSAAGKTALMEAVLSFVPPEDQVKFSAMTGQSLYYMGESELKHKILAIVEEEGAERASYALKLLQSEGELRIASTGKDASSGRLITQEYRVEGPMMLFLTTTAIKIDEELLNRCLVLTVDEDRDQTRAIHQLQRQRQTLQGLLAAQDRQHTLALHRNAQRLLRPLLVANPYAEALTFLDDKTRTRRDHVKYLTLIRVIALLHQFQRPVRTIEHQERKVEYIEVTLEDIEVANRLANEVLGRSVDDLPPQTRRLLGLIDQMVTQACQQRKLDRADFRFSRREVRSFTGWGHTQLKVHLKRLEELEYLLVHRGGRGQSFVYELLYEARADDGQKFLARLIDVEQLRRHQAGQNGQKSARGRPQVGVKSAQGRPAENDATPDATCPNSTNGQEPERNGHLD
jgi:DNA primase